MPKKKYEVLDLILEHLPSSLHAQLFDDAKQYFKDNGVKFPQDEPTSEEIEAEIKEWADKNKPAATN